MKSLRLSALAAVLALAACSSTTPTDPAANGSRASFDEVPGVGPGNFTAETQEGGTTLSGTPTTGSGNTTTSDGSESDPTRSGVGTMGSGG